MRLGIGFTVAAVLSLVGIAIYDSNLTSDTIALSDFYEQVPAGTAKFYEEPGF